MKQYFTTILLLLMVNIGISQDNTTETVYIKYAPLSLLDPFTPSIQFAVEHKLSDFKSMHYDLGCVFPANYFSYNAEKGYRTRIEYRVYPRGFYTQQTNFFHGLNLIAKQTVRERMSRICITPDCSSTIKVPMVRLTTSAGVAYGFGWNRVSSKGGLFEFEMVSGVVYYTDHNLGLPPFANPNIIGTFINENDGLLDLNDTFVPTFHFILRFGISTKN